MSIGLFDSHCHPQFPQYDADREEVIKRTLAAGCGMVCVGTDLEMSKKAIELAEKYDGPPSPEGYGRAGVWAMVGLHPTNLSFLNDRLKMTGLIGELKELASHPKVVGVGEVGLDYYRTPEKEKQEKQKEVFRQFLRLAAETGKPLIIHCRDAAPNFSAENLGGQAYDDMIQILQTTNYILQTRGVVHSFTGNFELAQKFLDLGFYLGLNGIITFTDEYDDMVANVPLDKILVETDAPYLAPVPHRGKRNEPLYVEFVARRIAELKKVSLEEVIKQTTNNATKLFNLNG